MTNFDLKTLNLADGDYEITVVARADGYLPSQPSNAVQYMVGSEQPETYTISAGTYQIKTELDLSAYFDVNTQYPFEFSSNGNSYTEIYIGVIGSFANKIQYLSSSLTDTVYDSGWTNEVYRTITIDTPQEVSQDFYEWFTANTNIQIPAGTYTFIQNPNLSVNVNADYSFYFITTNVPDTYFREYSDISVYDNQIVYLSAVDPDEDFTAYINGSWQLYGGYDVKTITLETPQTVSAEFGTWFTANTVKQYETYMIKAGNYTLEECAFIDPSDFDDGEFTADISFVSNNTSYSKMTIDSYYVKAQTTKIYYDNIEVSFYENMEGEYDNSWKNNNHRYITITSDTNVSKEFYERFDALSSFTTLITFTIGGTTYQAENGMTWAEWCESEYNTNKYFSDGGGIKDNKGVYNVCLEDDIYTSVSDNDIIFAGYNYYEEWF